MKDKLVVDFRNGRYRVVWWIASENDFGGTVGEGITDVPAPNPCDEQFQEEWEVWTANQAAAKSPGVEKNNGGYFWETESQAKAALRLCKAALKQERPLPDWAVKALAAGWKAPKGWKA